MKKIILYIAMSLDGYIADENDSVAWLNGDGSDPKNLGSYLKFEKMIDTIILGHTTYHQIINELSPDVWPYQNKKSYILTHRKIKDTGNIIFTCETILGLISRLKLEEGKAIWLCGGASIVNQAIKDNLIDEFWITIIPIIIGSGVRLFDKQKKFKELKLISTKSYNGMVDLVYRQR